MENRPSCSTMHAALRHQPEQKVPRSGHRRRFGQWSLNRRGSPCPCPGRNRPQDAVAWAACPLAPRDPIAPPPPAAAGPAASPTPPPPARAPLAAGHVPLASSPRCLSSLAHGFSTILSTSRWSHSLSHHGACPDPPPARPPGWRAALPAWWWLCCCCGGLGGSWWCWGG